MLTGLMCVEIRIISGGLFNYTVHWDRTVNGPEPIKLVSKVNVLGKHTFYVGHFFDTSLHKVMYDHASARE